MAVPDIKKINPNHLPNINPASKPSGERNPSANIQIIVNKMNNVPNKNRFDCLKS